MTKSHDSHTVIRTAPKAQLNKRLVDRIEDIEKSSLLGRAFTSFTRGTLSFESFRTIGRAIERCMLDDLRENHQFDHANDAHSEIVHDLTACGLITMVQLPAILGPDARPMYKITEFGELFGDVVLICIEI